MTEIEPAADMFGGGPRWIVQVRFAIAFGANERQLEAMSDAADEQDITVAALGRPDEEDGAGLLFTAEVPADEIGLVPTRATEIARETCGYTLVLPTFVLVDFRVMTPELYEAEAVRPDTPELLAATDVAELLGVSRQRVHQLSSERADFPAPYARLGSGPIWTRPVIEAFDRAWTRKPGRPAKAS